MNPDIWGPPAWKFLHSVPTNYPLNPTTQDKEQYKLFFEQLCYVLPCIDCCFNYQKELKLNNIDDALESREKLFKWVVDLHNSVNKRLNKKEMSLEKAKAIYDGYLNNDVSMLSKYKNPLMVIAGLSGVIGFLAYKKKL
jgi:hypothetical protein